MCQQMFLSSELEDMGVQKGKKVGSRYVQWIGETLKGVSKLVSQLLFSWN